MAIKSFSFLSFATLVVGALGVFGPIAWDYYKTKSEVELSVIGRSVIVSRPEKIDGLQITYAGEALDELSKTSFALTNSGRTPISMKDVVNPVALDFSKDSSVIDVVLDAVYPENLGANLNFDKEKSKVTVSFPLLNPGDKIIFSVLGKVRDLSFTASARISGVPELSISREVAEKQVSKRPSLLSYVVVSFSMLLGTLGVYMLFRVPAEVRMKKIVKRGELLMPQFNSKIEVADWINSVFRFMTTSEKRGLHKITHDMNDVCNMTSDDKLRFMAEVRDSLAHSVSNFTVAIVVLMLAAFGFLYVF
ncbi:MULTISPECIES: hypothetical protein [unclassified Pseudomonas]|uniref:hypothetical protein n=1 Tax=unclassified Pseudomonas TaxID=196821 RepID=UPI000A1F3056|nr:MULTISPECIES: hypothetical protein [unclassified Pseudomonas]